MKKDRAKADDLCSCYILLASGSSLYRKNLAHTLERRPLEKGEMLH